MLLLIWGIAPSVATTPQCAQTVGALPRTAHYRSDDPRLNGGALIVVEKAARRAAVYAAGQLATTSDGSSACFPVALAAGYVAGNKRRRGDLRTPEGWQRTSDRPWSSFYGGITVHYPTTADAKRGLRDGVITQAQHDAIVQAQSSGKAPPMNTALGGLIVLHGGGATADWTLGCVAFHNPDLDAMRALLPAGMKTDLLILP